MANETKKIGTGSWRKKDVRERLKKLPTEKQRRFAWMCAVHALPFLSVSDGANPFYYWNDKIQEYLWAVLRGLDVAAATVGDYANFSARDTDAFAANRAIAAARATADAFAARAAAYAAYAACAACAANRATADAIAARAAAFAVYAARTAAFVAYDDSVKNYLGVIFELNLKSLEEDALYRKYSIKTPKIESSQYEATLLKFWADLRKVGCDYWADWYEQLFADGFALDNNRIMEIQKRLILSSSSHSAEEVATNMNQWKNENSVKQSSAARVEETPPEISEGEENMPDSIDFYGLDITKTDLKKLCEAKYTVVAGENGCGKTRLLKALREYINKAAQDVVAIFADFANAYFNFGEAQEGEKDQSEDIVEILLDVHSKTSLADMSACKNFNDMLAATKKFLSYLLLPKQKLKEQREMANVRMVFYENFGNFFGLIPDNEGQVTEYLQEFEKNFSQKSPGQKMLCYFAMLISVAQVKGKKIYLLIDEPESHLHHKKVAAFVDALRGLQNASVQMMIMIATHSHYIVAKSAFNELLFLKDNKIQKKDHRYKQDTLKSLMGESGENLLYDMYAEEFCAFVAECLEPAEPEGTKKTDAYNNLRPILNTLPVGEWLDFGAGKGRLAVNIDSITGRDNLAKTKCVAYEYIENPEREKKNAVKANLDKLYKKTLINNELNEYVKTDENNKFSAVFMVNVLHEIPIDQWVETFKKIADALCKNGRLIFCETIILSMGEREKFLVLDKESIVELFGVNDNAVGTMGEKVIWASISAEQLMGVNNNEKLLEVLQNMKDRYKEKYISTSLQEDSRKKAFYACSCINIDEAVDTLKKLVDQTKIKL